MPNKFYDSIMLRFDETKRVEEFYGEITTIITTTSIKTNKNKKQIKIWDVDVDNRVISKLIETKNIS